MKYYVDKEIRPVYLELYRRLRDDIVGGLYSYGEKLPSKRSLAEAVGVSTVTVEHAYALLCEEGYAEGRARSGYLVTFRKTDGFASAARPEHIARHADRVAPPTPEFPLSLLSKTMRRVLSEQGEFLLEKSPNRGLPELRTAISRYLARNRGIRATPEQIVIGAGSEYLYGLIIELLGRERVYAIESPSYRKIEEVYRAAALAYECLPLTPTGIDSDALTAASASVLHTTPYRSYPSGVTATASKRHEYVRWAGEGDRYIIEDDYESEFSVSSKPTETLFSLSPRENVIYLNTFSRTVSPSLRVGYMVLPPPLVRPYCERLGFYSCTVPTFMQYVLAELLEHGDFERHINRVRRRVRRELFGQ